MRASMWWVMLLILIGGAAGWEMSKLLVAFIEEGIARRKHEQWLKENDE
jgi:post-segregation antitoxin (ccd killing protein)